MAYESIQSALVAAGLDRNPPVTPADVFLAALAFSTNTGAVSGAAAVQLSSASPSAIAAIVVDGSAAAIGPSTILPWLRARFPEVNPGRIFSETIPIASLAAAPTFPIVALLSCRTTLVGGAGQKMVGALGAVPGAGAAAPNAGGTSIVFNAETTGTGFAAVSYVTSAPL